MKVNTEMWKDLKKLQENYYGVVNLNTGLGLGIIASNYLIDNLTAMVMLGLLVLLNGLIMYSFKKHQREENKKEESLEGNDERTNN